MAYLADIGGFEEGWTVKMTALEAAYDLADHYDCEWHQLPQDERDFLNKKLEHEEGEPCDGRILYEKELIKCRDDKAYHSKYDEIIERHGL